MTESQKLNPISKRMLTEYWAASVYNALGQMVRAYREAKNKGITQEIIAIKLGKNKSVISRILKGHNKNLTIKTLSEMALAMEHSLQINFVRREDIARQNYMYSSNDFSKQRIVAITGRNSASWDNRQTPTMA